VKLFKIAAVVTESVRRIVFSMPNLCPMRELWLKVFHLGDEPRRVLNELSKINLVDVVLPTSAGVEIRKRCITRPTELLR